MYGSIHRSIDLSTSIYLSIYLPIHPSIRPPFLSTAHRPKVVRMWCVLNMLTSKWAFHLCYDVFRATGTRVFSTSQLPKMAGDPQYFNTFAPQNCPNVVCFWHFDFEICFASTAWIFWTLQLPKVVRTCMVCLEHFDFEMCFAPKLRALFEHLKFQKWSEHAVLSSFLLWYVLFATTAYTFWTSQLPRALQEWGFSSVLTFKSASRHKGMPFFISHLTRWLRTRRFSEPTFPLLSDSISSLIFFLLRFSCLTLPTSAASSVHILRSLAFKLPSIFTSHYASVCAHILMETDVSVVHTI